MILHLIIYRFSTPIFLEIAKSSFEFNETFMMQISHLAAVKII